MDLSDEREGEDRQPFEIQSRAKRRRRDIRACASCRRSKVRCDGNKPCTRCARIKSECFYVDIIKDPVTQRMEALEAEIRSLKSDQERRRNNSSSAGSGISIPTSAVDSGSGRLVAQNGMHMEFHEDRAGMSAMQSADVNQGNSGSISHPSMVGSEELDARSRWSMFQWSSPSTLNAVQRGIVSEHQAFVWFQTSVLCRNNGRV
jgi:hypothetical protein